MRKQFFSLFLLGMLCSIGNVWGDEYALVSDPTGTPTLTSNFLIGNLTLNQSTTATIDGINFKKAIKFGSSLTSISGKKAGENNICYDVKTTSTTFTVYVSGGTGTLYFSKISEGSTTTTVESKTITTNPQKLSFTFESSTNTKVGFSVSSTNMFVYQIIAEETGTAHKKAGEAGYTLNLNKGRYTGDNLSSAGGKSGKLDNLEIVSYNAYTCTNSTVLELTKNSSDAYIKFTTGTSECNVKVTFSAGTLIANTSKSTSGGVALTSNTAAKLAASTTYYIINTHASNRASITKIEFERASSVSKSITAAGWATYCSPYALDLENAEGLTDAYIVIDGENGVLSKTSVKGGTVPANTGLLLKGPEGTATIPTVASSSTNVDANILKGVTENTLIAAGTGWVLMNDGSHGLGFYQNTDAFTVGAKTAYILVSDLPVPTPSGDAPSRFWIEEEENNATDIQSIETSEKAVKFIENGQLLIMRDGVVYDTTGRVIR